MIKVLYGRERFERRGKIPLKLMAQRAAASSKQRAKKYGVISTVTTDDILNAYEAADGKCYYCGRYFGAQLLTIDHIQPLSKGGPNTPDNLRCACHSCNASKNNGTYENFIRRNRYEKFPLTITDKLRQFCSEWVRNSYVHDERGSFIRRVLNLLQKTKHFNETDIRYIHFLERRTGKCFLCPHCLTAGQIHYDRKYCPGCGKKVR